MRILLLAPQPLVPLEDGLNIRLRYFFRDLAARHSIWLCHLQEEPGPSEPAPIPFVATTTVPIMGSRGRAFRHCRDYSIAMERAIRRVLETAKIDVVVASSIYMVEYVRRLTPLPVVVDLVDAMSLLIYRDMKRASRPVDTLRLLRAWWGYRQYERRRLGAFRELVLVSEVDAAVVRKRAPCANVTVIPNGVDTDYFQPQPGDSGRTEVVFSGVIGFPPNAAAVTYFYAEVLPRVWKAYPDLRFTVVGKSPPDDLARMLRVDPRVTVTGFVPDIRPYLNRAAVYVAPMVSGSGIKNKILEAFAMAKPVVATSVACDGLGGRPGETLMVADDPEGFADAVITLLKDPGLRDRMGRQGRAHVLTGYSWRRQAEQFEALLERASGRAPSAGPDRVEEREPSVGASGRGAGR
ncbi:MAG: glycosyltransferase family 4 protein [Nitrospirota bacterium]